MSILSTKKIYLVGAVSLVLGILFTVLFFDKLIGISFVIYTALLVTCVFGLLSFFKVSYSKSSIWFVPAIIFFSSMVALRDNEFLVFINCIMTIGLLLLLAHQITGHKLKHSLFVDYVKTAVVLPLIMLGKSFNALGRMISVGKGTVESKKTSQIVKGIFITLPIVGFFLLLFSSADVVFKNLVTDIFSFNFTLDENVVPKIWWAIFFAVVWLGAYVFILENATEEENSRSPVARSFKFGNIEAGILFTTLNVLFLTFVGIQIKYLFAGHEAITKLGYTYAEYVHKGFGELVFVAIFVFLLIFIAERYIERNENKSSLLFKSLARLLVVLVLVIMVSAFTRLSAYEEVYGFTTERVLVQAFIIWLAAVFSWLEYKLAKGIDDQRFIFGLFLSAATFVAAFSLFNPDAFVARKNIDQFAKNGKLDTTYLSLLSADAIPELIPLLDMSGVTDEHGNQLPQEVAYILKNHYDYAVPKQFWQSYNVARRRAMQLIDNKRGAITTLTSVPQNATIFSSPTQE